MGRPPTKTKQIQRGPLRSFLAARRCTLFLPVLLAGATGQAQIPSPNFVSVIPNGYGIINGGAQATEVPPPTLGAELMIDNSLPIWFELRWVLSCQSPCSIALVGTDVPLLPPGQDPLIAVPLLAPKIEGRRFLQAKFERTGDQVTVSADPFG